MPRRVQHTPIDPDLPLFARRLKAARVLAELSQERLGVEAGVDEFSASARINQYERGKHTPDVLMAGHLARVLNVPLAYFWAQTEAEADLLCLFHRLPSKLKTQALRLLKELSIP